MGFELEHPNLTAYALGELDGEALAKTEELLARSEDARRRVEEIRAAAGAVKEQIVSQLGPELRTDQIDQIRARLEGRRKVPAHDEPTNIGALVSAKAVPIAPSVVVAAENETRAEGLDPILPAGPRAASSQPPHAVAAQPAGPRAASSQPAPAQTPRASSSQDTPPEPVAPKSVPIAPSVAASASSNAGDAAPEPRRLRPVPRAPSRAKKRSPLFAFSAAAVIGAAVGATYLLTRPPSTSTKPDPIVLPTPVDPKPAPDPQRQPDLAEVLRARAKNAELHKASVTARSFKLDDPGAVRAPTSPEAPLSLTTSDGTGLRLTSLTARAVIEEPLAFTELHLVFNNPEPRTIEGRFAITLPEGATISRFAMKIGGHWQEGEVVEKQAARAAYEDFLHRRQDPALLEQAGGNEFTARVFPIPARATKELIVSYSHELTRADEPYRLALLGLPEIGEADIRALISQSTSTGDGPTQKQVMELRKQKWTPDRDIVVDQAHHDGRLGLRHDNIVVARIAPVPDTEPDEIRSLFVLLDTSASRALGFSAQVQLVYRLISGLAAGAGPEIPIAVACFDQQVEMIYEGPARGFGFEHVRRIEDRTALGASDFARALAFVHDHLAKGKTYSRVLLVSDGVANTGEIEPSKLTGSVRALRKVEVERLDAIATGGIRDEALLGELVTAGLPRDGTVADDRWDLARIARKLTERTYSDVQVAVEGAEWVWPDQLHGVQAGDQVMLYAELAPEKPFRVSLSGVPISTADRKLVRGERPLLERAFAKARIDRLTHTMATEAAAQPDLRKAIERQIVELSVRHRVLSPLTSLVVLETEADYARFGIDRRARSQLLTVIGDRLNVIRPGQLPGVAGERRVAKRKAAPARVRPTDLVLDDDASVARGDAEGESRIIADETAPDVNVEASLDGAGDRATAASAPAAEPEPPPPVVQAPPRNDPAKPAAAAAAVKDQGAAKKSKLAAAFDELAFEERAQERTASLDSAPATESASPPREEAKADKPRVARGALDFGEKSPAGGASVTVRGVSGTGVGAAASGVMLNQPTSVTTGAPITTSPRAAEQERQTRHAGAAEAEEANALPYVAPNNALDANKNDKALDAEKKGASSGADTPRDPDELQDLFLERTRRLPGATTRRDPGRGAVRRPPARHEIFRAPYHGQFAEIMALVQRGASGEARVRAERWRVDSPGDVMALIALGEACESGGDVQRAERAYGSIIDLFPSRADLRRFAGERLDRLHSDYARVLAEDTYAKAALDRPDHPTGRRLHAYAVLKLGRPAEAFEEIESVLTQRSRPSRVAYERFYAAHQVLREDLGLIGRAWIRAEPHRRQEILNRLARAGAQLEDGPSLKFVLNWETDANDVDLHVYDARGGHAFFGQLSIAGGSHYGGVFTGYGPECVTIRRPRGTRPHPYAVKVHYYARGPMGYGMGKVQIIEHDGDGGLSFDERPFVAMNDLALVDLGVVR